MNRKIFIILFRIVLSVLILFIFFTACNNGKQAVDQDFLNRYRNTEIELLPTDLLFASEDIVIVYDEQAVIVFDLGKKCITGAVDLKEIGMNRLQGGEDITHITASLDGSIVFLEKYPAEADDKKYIYHTDKNELIQVDSYEKYRKDRFNDYYERSDELEGKLEFVKNESNPSGLNLIKLNEEKWVYLRHVWHKDLNTYDGLEIVIWTPNNTQIIPIFN